MRSAELLTLGVDRALSAKLASWTRDRGVWHRPLEHAAALRSLVRKGSRGVALVRLGRNLTDEFSLVHELADHFPDVAVVVLGDLDHPLLQGLAYDLGAAAVVFRPRGADELFEILARMNF